MSGRIDYAAKSVAASHCFLLACVALHSFVDIVDTSKFIVESFSSCTPASGISPRLNMDTAVSKMEYFQKVRTRLAQTIWQKQQRSDLILRTLP